MDAMKALKAEMDRKRKLSQALTSDISSTSSGGLKFVRKSDLMEKEEEVRLEKQKEYDLLQKKQSKDNAIADQSASLDIINKPAQPQPSAVNNESSALLQQLQVLDLKQIQSKLRLFGKPITLYGENTVTDRLNRLIVCYESMVSVSDSEFDQLDAIDNNQPHDVNSNSNAHEDSSDEEEDKGSSGGSASSNSISATSANSTVPKVKWYLDPSIKYTEITRYSKEKMIYKYFKGLLKRWGYLLNMRSDYDKYTSKGKLETQGHQRCKEYLKDFFKMCLTKTLDKDILPNLYAIVHACEEHNYVLAHDWYIRTAIGNSAWPIGVTMVGIHERSGREKITKVAHVMNNELSRKYLTSMKRLMSFAQSQATDVAPSMKVC